MVDPTIFVALLAGLGSFVALCILPMIPAFLAYISGTQYGITYPVVQDNDFKTWKAFENNYWPRKYIADHEGYLRYDHIGNGKYDETEKIIQELLLE